MMLTPLPIFCVCCLSLNQIIGSLFLLTGILTLSKCFLYFLPLCFFICGIFFCVENIVLCNQIIHLFIYDFWVCYIT